MAEKLDRKQLKQPDEFQQTAGHAMEWMVANGRKLALGAAVVVAVALLAWGASAYRNSREQKAGGELADALEKSGRPVAGDPGAQPGAETFATKDERTKATTDALEKVRNDFGGTTAGHTATAQLGFLKLKNGDAAGAQPLLSEYLDKAGKDDPLRIVAQEALGNALEQQGKLDDARAAYQKLADAGAPERSAYDLARLAQVQGKPEAKDLLEKVAKDYPKDPVAMDAQRRLELASLPAASAQPTATPVNTAPAKPAAVTKPTAKPATKKK